MKEFNCKSCNKTWFVKLDMADEVTGCPFCLKELPKPRVIVVDSFENAVLKIIVDYGTEIVSDRRKFLSYLTDVAFDYRKEIKILSNACDARTFVCFYELTQCAVEDARIKVKQIEKKLVDEEGIAETWAKRICDCFMSALREDYSMPTSAITTSTVKSPKAEEKKESTSNTSATPKSAVQVPTKNNAPSSEQRLLSSGYSRLSSGLWDKAIESFDEVLRTVDSPRAYLGKMMAAHHIRKESDIATTKSDIESDPNWVLAITTATGSYKDKLKRYEQDHRAFMSKIKVPEKPTRATTISRKMPEVKNQVIVPSLKPERVKSIYQWEISKIVSQPNFPNWFNKKNSRRVYFNELILPNSVTQINDGQFQNDKSFDWLIIGNGLKTIPKRAFKKISAEYVYLSDDVERIEDYAFADSDIKCVIIANHSNISISDTAFLRSNNVKLFFEHEWFSAIVKHCDSNKIAHAGLGPMEAYFAEYAKIKLKEKEIN